MRGIERLLAALLLVAAVAGAAVFSRELDRSSPASSLGVHTGAPGATVVHAAPPPALPHVVHRAPRPVVLPAVPAVSSFPAVAAQQPQPPPLPPARLPSASRSPAAH